jgi:hypothetical protein
MNGRRGVTGRTLAAILPRLEFERLLGEFEQDRPLLSDLGVDGASKVEIPLTPEFRSRASRGLSDRLYSIACRIPEEKFFSYYCQYREIAALPRSRAGSILEVGVKGGVFNSLIRNSGYDVTTFDIDPVVGPDIVGNVLDTGLPSESFDAAVCFEVLEHLPYDRFPAAVSELARVSRNYVFLSLPYSCNDFHFEFRLRLVQRLLHRLSGTIRFHAHWPSRYPDIDVESLRGRPDMHNPHYWEIGRRGFPKRKVLSDIEAAGLRIMKTFHSPRKAYHFFILCEKR